MMNISRWFRKAARSTVAVVATASLLAETTTVVHAATPNDAVADGSRDFATDRNAQTLDTGRLSDSIFFFDFKKLASGSDVDQEFPLENKFYKGKLIKPGDSAEYTEADGLPSGMKVKVTVDGIHLDATADQYLKTYPGFNDPNNFNGFTGVDVDKLLADGGIMASDVDWNHYFNGGNNPYVSEYQDDVRYREPFGAMWEITQYIPEDALPDKTVRDENGQDVKVKSVDSWGNLPVKFDLKVEAWLDGNPIDVDLFASDGEATGAQVMGKDSFGYSGFVLKQENDNEVDNFPAHGKVGDPIPIGGRIPNAPYTWKCKPIGALPEDPAIEVEGEDPALQGYDPAEYFCAWEVDFKTFADVGGVPENLRLEVKDGGDWEVVQNLYKEGTNHMWHPVTESIRVNNFMEGTEPVNAGKTFSPVAVSDAGINGKVYDWVDTEFSENGDWMKRSLSQPLLVSRDAKHLSVTLGNRPWGKTGSRQGVVAGLFLPTDHGDLPKSYGAATHMIDEWATNDKEINAKDRDVESASTYFLGSKEPEHDNGQFSDNAKADTEEDISVDHFFHSTDGKLALGCDGNATTEFKTTVPVGGTDTQGKWVTSWIDWNQNGEFESGERAAAPVNNGNAELTWPAGIPKLQADRMLNARVRVADKELNSPTVSVIGGEVEDLQVGVSTDCPEFEVEKTAVGTTAEKQDDGSFKASFDVTVKNISDVDGTSGALADDPYVMPGFKVLGLPANRGHVMELPSG